jgi:hypothetical protein
MEQTQEHPITPKIVRNFERKRTMKHPTQHLPEKPPPKGPTLSKIDESPT